MAKSNVTLIFLFVGVFLLLMLAIAGLSAKDRLDTTNTSEVQDIQNEQDAQVEGISKPFLLGLSGFQMILLVVLILGGIGVFLKLILGRRH